METWSLELRMLAVLGATRALVANSPNDGWPDEDPEDCVAVLDQMMGSLVRPSEVAAPRFASVYFAPTGPIQEIAMSNGWHDAYRQLAAEVDALEKELALLEADDA